MCIHIITFGTLLNKKIVFVFKTGILKKSITRLKNDSIKVHRILSKILKSLMYLYNTMYLIYWYYLNAQNNSISKLITFQKKTKPKELVSISWNGVFFSLGKCLQFPFGRKYYCMYI